MPSEAPLRRRLWGAILAGLTLCSAAGVVVAETLKPDDAIALRRGAYALQGHYFTQLKPMVAGNTEFNADAAQRLISRIAHLLPMAAELFPAGSAKGDTKARAEIWSRADDFAARQRQAVDAMSALSGAASAGDQAAFKAAYFDAAGACKQCHDDFRRR